MMKKLVISLSIILLTSIILFASQIEVRNLTARSNKSDIRLFWNITSETNLELIEIERSINNADYFVRIGDVEANGSKNYEFIDKEAYYIINERKGEAPKGEAPKNSNILLSDKVYHYRLKLILKDGSSITTPKTAPLVHSVNSVKRTWGMLKEMFR